VLRKPPTKLATKGEKSNSRGKCNLTRLAVLEADPSAYANKGEKSLLVFRNCRVEYKRISWTLQETQQEGLRCQPDAREASRQNSHPSLPP